MKRTLDYLYSLRNQGSNYGIERMELLLDQMGREVLSFPVIHVAGTNGKGSTCAMLDSIYRSNGYKVGLFSSPHLVELGERIRVNGEILSELELLQYVEKLRPLAEGIEKKHPGMHPSFFELITAVSFYVFNRHKVDIAVLETGLGGRLDSTNVVRPEVSVITTISLDHCHILGDTVEKIALEKAGIIKEGCPVITGWIPKAAEEVIQKVAREKKSPYFTLAGQPSSKNLPQTNLPGIHQERNAALALKTAKLIQERFSVKEEISRKALGEVNLHGRWETINYKPQIILDACHNQEGAQILEQQLSGLPKNKDLVVWFGSLAEERASEILSVIFKFAKEIRFFVPKQPRACQHETLCSMVPQFFKGKVLVGKIKEVNSYLPEIGKDQILLVTGSIYLLGEMMEIVKNQNNRLGARLQDLI